MFCLTISCLEFSTLSETSAGIRHGKWYVLICLLSWRGDGRLVNNSYRKLIKCINWDQISPYHAAWPNINVSAPVLKSSRFSHFPRLILVCRWVTPLIGLSGLQNSWNIYLRLVNRLFSLSITFSTIETDYFKTMPFLRHNSNAITPIIARQFLSIFMYDLSKNIANPTKIIKNSLTLIVNEKTWKTGRKLYKNHIQHRSPVQSVQFG